MSTASTIWYFAYGSNLSRTIFVDRRRMQPLAARAGRLADYRLHFNLPVGPGERGVANVEPETGAGVWGVAYLLSGDDGRLLDRSEGVHMGLYRRIEVAIRTDGHELLHAFTYRSARTRPGRKPSRRYMDLMLEGARAHGLPRAWIEELARTELAWDERTGTR
jgi:cation transport regulator ChaC